MKLITKILLLLLLLVNFSIVHAVEEFTIEDIRIEGLQRLTPGTIFNYLPVKIGDKFNDKISAESLRNLFGTGFFDDVVFQRDGNILLVNIKERPTIGSLEIDGNKDITTENLMKGLKEVGFTEGQVFDQSQLEKLERELQRQYFSNGKYGVNIRSTVDSLANNRVGISVKISEGDAAKIRQINIIGNKVFPEELLLEEFELSPSTLMSFFSKNDQYSRQKLSGDMEKLQSYYQDKGYINFNIDSTQVTITPDKTDIYITINITEGELYTISSVKLAGELIVPDEELFDLVSIRRDSLFSRKEMNDSSERITEKLGAVGYSFSNVNAVPDVNEENNTVDITFFIDPGKRVYVRRINFIGNVRTRDEVLRREMRQVEGGWISTPQVERGKIRLQRLGYFEEVNVETPTVPGSADQVDVEYTVEERPFGNFTAGLGYSQIEGLVISTSIAQNNLFGSGNRISFSFNNSSYNRVFSLGYVNPYFTDDGISRGYNFNYQETDGFDANITAYDSRIIGSSVNFGFPISEFNSISTSIGYENTELSEDGFFADQVKDFINREGNQFDVIRLSVGFAYDTRDDLIMPDSGLYHQVLGEITVPTFGNSLEFYKLSYRSQLFYPLPRGFIFALKADLGYGDGYLGTEGLPFFEHYYAGGPRSIRGYTQNALGPKDNFGRPLGGNVKVVAGSEVIIPIPFLEQFDQFRFSAFVDAGNVYCTGNAVSEVPSFITTNTVNSVGSPLSVGSVTSTTISVPLCTDENRFDLGELRYSAGLGAVWISPLGVMSFSISTPFNNQVGDDTEKFQFNIGTSF